MQTSKVTMIVPVLNAVRYIRECMESVVNQKDVNLEVICLDARSTDGTREILNEFAAAYDFVKIITTEVRSYGYQVNTGIRNATGKYIGILESDDFLAENSLKHLVELADANELDVIKANFNQFYCSKTHPGYDFILHRVAKEDGDYGRIFSPWLGERDLCYSAMSTWAGIYRRDFLLENRTFHNESAGASYQDNGFWVQTMVYAKRMMLTDSVFYCYRVDNPDASTVSREKIFCVCDEYDFIDSVLPDTIPDRHLLAQHIFLHRYKNYIYTMKRIDPKYLPAFYKRMQADFQKASKSGAISPELLDRNERRANEYIAYVLSNDTPIQLKDLYDVYNEKSVNIHFKVSGTEPV